MADIAFVSLVFIVVFGLPLWGILLELRRIRAILVHGLIDDVDYKGLPYLNLVFSRLHKLAYGEERP